MQKRKPRQRRGSTLIELLVALLLLDLAILSLATFSAVAARRVGDAGRLSRSSLAATNRLERLASRPCATITAGSLELEPRVAERWTLRRVPGAAEVTDSIDLAAGQGGPVVVRSRIPC